MIEAYLEGLSNVSAREAAAHHRGARTRDASRPARRARRARFGPPGATVTFLEFEPDLPLLLSQSDVVVSMAGYNTICELLLFARRAVLVPRAEPVLELFVAPIVCPAWHLRHGRTRALEPDVLMGKVLDALKTPRRTAARRPSTWPGCRAFASAFAGCSAPPSRREVLTTGKLAVVLSGFSSD